MGGNHSKAKDKKKSKTDENDKKKLTTDEYDKAMLDAKIARDRVIKYKKRIQEDNAKQIEIARRLVQSNRKEEARVIMRLKKQREVYINRTDKMIENLQVQIDQMERSRMENEVIRALKEANSVIQKLTDEMPIDEIEALMDSNEELAERVNEISSILSREMIPEDQKLADEEYEEMLNKMIEDDDAQNAKTPVSKTAPQPVTEQEKEEEEAEEPQKIAALA